MTEADVHVGPRWITVAAGTPLRVEGPVRMRRVFIQVIASAALVIIAVALVGVVAARRLAEVEAVNGAAQIADVLADAVVQPHLAEGLLTGDAAALATIDQAVREQVLSPSIVRVKIWNPQGRILYSDEARLIGQTFPLGDDEKDVLTNPKATADVSDLQKPENVYERDSGKLLEAYRPVWTPSGQPLLFEAYLRYDDVVARSGQLWRGFAGITLSSILLLVVLLLPVVWRLLERLKRSQDQREALLQRALDVSAEERRRIAGTLHDGVVQDLAATSFTVAGSAEHAAALGQPRLAAELHAASGTVRTTIAGLRSLLVDIYPPSLASAGLVAALEDLASGLQSRGICVDLDLPPVLVLDPDSERLIFRVAQECLHNVARHAAATRVGVRLSRSGTTAVLDITDDGIGFDVAAAMAEPAAGHFGLRVLGDVVTDAGAELKLASAPGAGTSWQLRVPVG